MAQITLEVATEHLETVLTILRNLKEGLLSEIAVDTKRDLSRPKRSGNEKIVKSDPKPVTLSSGKYIDPVTFKERLRRRQR